MPNWYSFILGRAPELSLAEMRAVLPNFTPFTIIESSAHFFIIETNIALDAKILMARLGGTIKIGEGLAVLSDTQLAGEKLARLLVERCAPCQKIYFAVSAYNALPKNINPRELGFAIKTELKEKHNRPSRLVSSREPTLSSVVVATNKLLSERGAELQMFAIKNKLYIARTTAVQDFADFNKRDYGRPEADPLSGMLPPKIARIMVNLAQIKEGERFLDPFCGSGTILMEAALLHPNNKLYGSDLSERAINDTKKNLEWLKNNYPRAARHISLLQSSIETLNAKISPQSIDVVVTEPFLGPPIRGIVSKEKLEQIMREINPLYERLLSVFKDFLSPNGRVVMIWPVFAHQKNWLELPAFRLINKFFDFEPLTKQSAGILCARPDQKVGRMIVKFKQKI